MDTAIRERMVRARTRLALDQPFWGSLALRLRLTETTQLPTMATDGVHLFYNPAFVETIPQDVVVGVVMHEVAHCAFGHPWRLRRLQKEHPLKANICADLAINPVIVDAGAVLPQGCLLEDRWRGKSAEYIWDHLEWPDPEEEGVGEGKGPGSGGQDLLSPGEGEGEASEGASEGTSAAVLDHEWKQAVRDAAETARKAQGFMPGWMEQFVEMATKPRTDPLNELLRLLSHHTREDYSMKRPNRVYAAAGGWLPSLHSERMGPIAIGLDTSGSISRPMLAQFLAWVQGILDDFRPVELRVYDTDAEVAKIATYEPGDRIDCKVKGGGGTSFVPAIAAAAGESEPPVAMVYLTDGYGVFPSAPPEFPVIWLIPEGCVETVPFGDIIRIPV